METDEPLETGYGPAAPTGDNACNDFAQGLAEAYLALAKARGARGAEDDAAVLTDARSPSFFANVAVLRRPLSDIDWRATAARMDSFYGERPGGDFLLFSAWPTPDLTSLGFGLVGHPPLMLRPPAPVPVHAVAGLEIRAVHEVTAAQDWERALVHAFPVTELQPFEPACLLPARALEVDGWHYWVGYLEGRPVATASAYLNAGHVHVEYVSTVESARGRGIGRAITAVATGLDPSLPAMLIASDPGRPVYERLGYRSILRFTLWVGHRRR